MCNLLQNSVPVGCAAAVGHPKSGLEGISAGQRCLSGRRLKQAGLTAGQYKQASAAPSVVCVRLRAMCFLVWPFFEGHIFAT